MGILEGKRILVAGVTMDTSIGFAVARVAQEQGATVADLQLRPRARHHQADRQAAAEPSRRCSSSTSPTTSTSTGLADLVREHVDGLDGVVHSIAYGNPETLLGGKFLDGPWEDVAQAVQVSAYSLKSLTHGLPAADGRRAARWSGMTFDATVAWPAYDWMGVAKAGAGVVHRATSPATSARRASGSTWSPPARSRRWPPRPSRASRSSRTMWSDRAPLGWDENDQEPTARAVVALLQRLLPGDHRRDRARRRRLPRDGRLSAAPSGSVRAVTSALVELRVLEGPNLYFPRAAIKLTLDLTR